MTMFSSDRRERGHRESLVAVQHAAGERRERDEQQVRERPAQRLDGQLELSSRFEAKPGAQTADEHGRDDHADNRYDRENPAERAGDRVDQLAHLVVLRLARYSATTGTNACENAPSANSRRSRFGIWFARTYTSRYTARNDRG